ncbi:MAG: universal stress protein UspA [Deltaproteobacteria bacterium SG8_13]|nr:MAG: universal stress protein UspA [Deltaproteobacteria bacterium SG8_13]
MKFLVGYDGSNAANDAIALACRYAAALQASVHVVTSMGKGTEDNQKEIDEAQRSLAYAESLFEKEGIPCETHLMIRGLSPGEDLVRFADENSVDLVFVGVKRRSKVGKLLMGSAAQYVILNAPAPVVSIR